MSEVVFTCRKCHTKQLPLESLTLKHRSKFQQGKLSKKELMCKTCFIALKESGLASESSAQKPKKRKQCESETEDAKQSNPSTEAKKSRKERKKLAKAAKWEAKKAARTGEAPLVDTTQTTQLTKDPSTPFLSAPLQAPIIRDAVSFFEGHGIRKLPLHLGPSTGWRTHAKLAVRGVPGEWTAPQIGLFEPGSHNVVLIPQCKAHHPSINAATHVIDSACRVVKVHGYHDETATGQLRYVVLSVCRSSGLVQCSLVWNSPSLEEAGPILVNLVETLKSKATWHSIWVNLHNPSKHDCSIVARSVDSWHRFFGPEAIEETLTRTAKLPFTAETAPKLMFPPMVFRQANLDAFEAIVQRVREMVPEGSVVTEFYAGVGTIGLHLADRVRKLNCSDENPFNITCFNQSLATLPANLQSRLSYTTSAAGVAAARGDANNSKVLIVDPPRKGLDEEVLVALSRSQRDKVKVNRLIYVSCGFNALKRDMKQLLGDGGGGWRLVLAEGFVLVPGANHLETLVVLDRDSK
eukprot:c8714_g1_i1.p1 GENE.c8714_g1_i1~~c8714_g1_i1.p1  ORF type:complete len:522 (-),score=54.74 c8714_g1_i1:675-2240(-)